MSSQPANTSDRLDVAACLRLPPLASASVVAGRAALDNPVTWTAVIEWPVEDFVSPGDLVLTTAMGCDERKLRELVGQIAAAGAAAIAIGVGPDGFLQTVPPALAELVDRAGVPLIELPWRVRFSDVSRAVAEQLYAREPTLPAAFIGALLEHSPVAGIAAALEADTGAAVVVFDATMAVRGSGAAGRRWIADQHREQLLVAVMVQLARRPAGVVRMATVDGTDSDVVAAPALSRDGTLGWVAAVCPQGTAAKGMERALSQASTAVAIELLREVANDEALSHARGSFLLEVTAGRIDTPAGLATRAALLGLPRDARYLLGVALVEHDVPSSARQVTQRLRHQLRHPYSMIATTENEIVLCLQEGDADWPRLRGSLQDGTVSWGVAGAPVTLAGLSKAASWARAALAVTKALYGPGQFRQPSDIEAYLMLFGLLRDPLATDLAARTLAPLAAEDRGRGPDLLGTLEAFLEENGNISAAARRLFVNRHTLIYRLTKSPS